MNIRQARGDGFIVLHWYSEPYAWLLPNVPVCLPPLPLAMSNILCEGASVTFSVTV
jgi:hypothetical protein